MPIHALGSSGVAGAAVLQGVRPSRARLNPRSSRGNEAHTESGNDQSLLTSAATGIEARPGRAHSLQDSGTGHAARAQCVNRHRFASPPASVVPVFGIGSDRIRDRIGSQVGSDRVGSGIGSTRNHDRIDLDLGSDPLASVIGSTRIRDRIDLDP
jgi:hypothetical protein